MKKFLLEKKKVILISIVVLLATIFSCVTLYNYSKVKVESKKVVQIEKLIEDEKYNEALDSINELPVLLNPNTLENVNKYKTLLNNYLKVDFNKDKQELVKELDTFSLENEDTLKLDIFSKMKESILSKVEAINKEIEDENIKLEEEKIELEEEKKKEEERLKEEQEKSDKEQAEKEQQVSSSSVDTENNLSIESTNAAKNSSQIVTVVSKGGSYAELCMWEKDSSGKWKLLDTIPARLGQNGMKVASQVYEMDKCTPTGAYTLTEAFGINTNPGSGVPYRQLDGSEYWVDDIDSQYYNTMQFGESNGRWNSAEKLIDFPGYYNYSLVIDYNRWPVVSGKSSAIFLHCDIGTYTYGCVAIAESKLVKLLNWIHPGSNPVMILDFSYNAIYSNY